MWRDIRYGRKRETRQARRSQRAAMVRRLWRLAFGLVTAIAIMLASDQAGAFTPTLNVDADGTVNANLNGQVKVDVEGLDRVVKQIDATLVQLAKSTQTSFRGDIDDVLRQTRAAINDQLAQVRSASVQAINLVAAQLDAQLRAVLTQAQAIASQAEQLIKQIANQAVEIVESIEAQTLAQIKQIHANLMEALKVVGTFIDQELDRIYVRSENTAANVAYASRAFVDNAFLVAVRCVLGGVLLLLALRIARDATEAVRKRSHLTAQPIAEGLILCGVMALLASKPLLAGVLGIPSLTAPPDPCAAALADYKKFREDNTAKVAPDTLRLEGANVQEELQRCAYLSVSAARAGGAEQLMLSVRAGLSRLPDAVAVTK
jgi:hypothetical protein